MPPQQNPVEHILSRLEGVHSSSPGEWTALCPAHDDHTPSLSIGLGEEEQVLLHCHAGCPNESIVEAIGLAMRDLFPHSITVNGSSSGGNTGTRSSSPRREVARYPYHDERGSILYYAVRYAPKSFAVFRPNGSDGVISGLGDTRRVPYRLPEVIAAVRQPKPVIIVEGEKDADSLANLGLAATTNLGGAGKWREEYNRHFAGAGIIILPDNDAPGRAHAEQVAAALYGVASWVRIVELPDLPVKGDVSNWLEAGGTKKEMVQLVRSSMKWEPTNSDHNAAASVAIAPVPAEPAWPAAPSDAAFHGLAGEIVHAVEPETEADPVGILTCLLTLFGNVIGRSAYYPIGCLPHHANIFTCLVGGTSLGRKGTAWNEARSFLAGIDPLAEEEGPTWGECRVKSGLSSGEGLIYTVRDGRDPFEEPDAEDKRLLAYEAEFATVLRVMDREGNTVSTRIREAWETGDLSTLTRKDPLKATNAYISIVGSITPAELRRYLKETETANGFANRILWVCVRKSKSLPSGGNFSEVQRNAFRERLAKAAAFAATVERMERDAEAEELWHQVYDSFDAEMPGMLGEVTSRAAPQVIRLSMIYALLDSSSKIRREHLKAALALWDYVVRSCCYLFGQQTGDPVADQLLGALKQAGGEGMNRTGLINLTGRNVSASRLQQALATLEAARLVRKEMQQTGGRPAEVWLVCQ